MTISSASACTALRIYSLGVSVYVLYKCIGMGQAKSVDYSSETVTTGHVLLDTQMHCGYYFCKLLLASTRSWQDNVHGSLFKSRFGYLRGVRERLEKKAI